MTTPPPSILAVGRALPPHFADQETLIAAFAEHWRRHHFNLDRLADLHRATRVGGRHLALPIAEYAALDTFAKSNAAFLRVGAEVGEAAVRDGLRRAGLEPSRTWTTSSSSPSPGSPPPRSMHGW